MAPTPPEYRLTAEFRRLFEGKIYKHRDSSQGDFVAMHLYEDLVAVNRSPRLIEAALTPQGYGAECSKQTAGCSR
jgi:hypothetical protein